MRKHLIAALALTVLVNASAFGQADPATWNRNVERLDYYMTNPSGGDNAFFTYVASATAGANVTLLYPANNSMKEFPQRLYKIRTNLGGATPTGCTNAYFNGLNYFMPDNLPSPPQGWTSMQGPFSRTRAYPDPGMEYTQWAMGGRGSWGDPDGLGHVGSGTYNSLADAITNVRSEFYRYGNWPGPQGGVSGVPGVPETVTTACTNANAARVAECVLCVTNSGYWLNPDALAKETGPTAGVFAKQFLRFHPPKWTLLALAYKRLVNGPLLLPLREGVLGTNGSTGAKVLQKMQPQSCNGTGRPLNQKLEAIDTLDYTGTARPLAEMLFNAAWFKGGQDSPWVWAGSSGLSWNGTRGTFPGTFPNTKSGPCNGCNSDFAILFSDGRGDSANPLCAGGAAPMWSGPPAGALSAGGPSCSGGGCTCSSGSSPNVVSAGSCYRFECVTESALWCERVGGVAGDCDTHSTCGAETAAGGAFCSTVAACSSPGLGSEMDGDQFELDPVAFSGSPVTATITGAAVRQTPAGTCAMDFADDVAGWMANNNVSSSGTSGTATVHVVGIGDPTNTYGEMSILSAIASRGNGRFVAADNFRDLEGAIELIFTSIRNQASSFASSAVTTVQTTGTSSAFIPRFTPSITGGGWKGTLSRFVLFNEFAAGCTAATQGNVALNPNQDTSCSDFYLKDAVGNFIQEDNTGQFVVSDNSAAWAAGWPMLLSADGGLVTATPYWEAGNQLTTRARLLLAGTPPAEGSRRIYTARPSGSGYGTTSGNTRAGATTQVAINLANVSAIAPLLGLGTDQNSETCTTLSAATGNTYASLDDCASDVIRFIHGEDVLRTNPANRVVRDAGTPDEPRLNVLGDIFHSSPILVTPPVPRVLCDIGVLNQCVASLYSQTLTPGGVAAYTSWSSAQAARSQTVLVGANDGMLHAFNAANSTGDGGFDNGTGVETWAFVPPDLLPKLVRNMIGERHELFVDGTPMVRDIWVDGSGATAADNAKQSDEYHTIVVIGQRQGGRGYTALDITNPANPVFLWSWPRPGTREALTMGQTWNDLGGAPPAIGPIARYNDPAGPLTINGDQANEQYVVAFGGGYDSNHIRGRSFHVVDAWTGGEVYRFSSADTNDPNDLRKKLAPVAAPISMIDADSDGLFDHALFGDLDGQVWNLSMMKPGRDTVGSDGLYDTWYMARAFEEFKTGAFKQKSSFFQRLAAGLLATGDIRVYLGSGDRAHLKDYEGGLCGPEDLAACFKRNCDVTVTQSTYAVGPPPSGSGGHYVQSGVTFSAGASYPVNNITYDSLGQVSSSSDVIKAYVSYNLDCPGPGAGVSDAGVTCDWGPDGGADCYNARPLSSVNVPQPATPSITDTRFYAIKLFEGSGARAKYMTQGAANAYDLARLTDTDLNNVSGCPDAGTCNLSISNDNGWFVQHGTAQAPSGTHKKDEKTAASALLFGGCVMWSTLDPIGVGGSSGSGTGTCGGDSSASLLGESCNSNADCFETPQEGTCVGGADHEDSCDNPNDCRGICNGGRDDGDDCRRNSDCRDNGTCEEQGVCDTPVGCLGLGSLSCTPSFPKDTAWSYQADAVNGGVSCGLYGSQTYNATSRAISRQVSVSPTQPAPVVSVNAATGTVQFGAVTLDAANIPTGVTLGSTQVSSTIHWLEVPRKAHDCRHDGTNCQ